MLPSSDTNEDDECDSSEDDEKKDGDSSTGDFSDLAGSL